MYHISLFKARLQSKNLIVMKTGFCFILTLHLLYLNPVSAGSDLKVLVSNKAFHSLVSGVMQGVSRPFLLLNGNISPHSYSLRPSAAENLQKSDLVFWGGEMLEGFLAKPIQSLATNAKFVSLQETEGLKKLLLRAGKEWQKTGPQMDHDNSEKNILKRPYGIDPHIWLDPLNAKVITNKIVQILSEMDPLNAQSYQRNGDKYGQRLDLLDQRLKAEMKEISSIPYIVFHDAYQYFERRYQLNSIGFVASHTGYGTSVRKLIEVRKAIKKKKIRCIFSEPQFSPKLVQTVIEGTSVKKGMLDPLGTGLKPGKELYFTLLINLSRSLRKCLL